MEELKNYQTSGHKKIIVHLAALFLLVAVIYLIAQTRNQFRAYHYIGRAEDLTHTITIAGEGKITAIPDIATFNIGVVTEKKAVLDAQTENTKKMNAIIEALKKMNINSKDIQTNVYSIYPQYDWTNNKQTLRGYEVNQSATIKIRDLTKVGEIIGKAGELGANNVSGLTFTIDEPEKIRQQAREKALLNAKEKAESLAKVAGVKLGKLVTFSENSNDFSSYRYDYAMKSEAVGLGGDAAVPAPAVESGSLDIIVNVSVSYEVL